MQTNINTIYYRRKSKISSIIRTKLNDYNHWKRLGLSIVIK
ncbi:hypothetical protein Bint_1420 [Brachyspira intermedia PWS/A]|uniref:Uncharacterized protein n=1 Tax=Brachyspira intermedia (strain ATCC 51140 / PWS/A) TaxID=1045858 RepID=G0EPX9_BRAIP|nr:hypothetical protein Bint_1420 [Brachyspira intermedia PWS/A]